MLTSSMNYSRPYHVPRKLTQPGASNLKTTSLRQVGRGMPRSISASPPDSENYLPDEFTSNGRDRYPQIRAQYIQDLHEQLEEYTEKLEGGLKQLLSDGKQLQHKHKLLGELLNDVSADLPYYRREGWGSWRAPVMPIPPEHLPENAVKIPQSKIYEKTKPEPDRTPESVDLHYKAGYAKRLANALRLVDSYAAELKREKTSTPFDKARDLTSAARAPRSFGVFGQEGDRDGYLGWGTNRQSVLEKAHQEAHLTALKTKWSSMELSDLSKLETSLWRRLSSENKARAHNKGDRFWNADFELRTYREIQQHIFRREGERQRAIEGANCYQYQVNNDNFDDSRLDENGNFL